MMRKSERAKKREYSGKTLPPNGGKGEATEIVTK